MQNDLEIAAGSPWLSAASAPFRERILALGRVQACRDREPIYLLGDDGGALFGILKGCILIEVPLPGDEVVAGDILCPGSWIGEAAVLSGQMRRIGARAAGAVTLLRISARDIQTMLAQHPGDWRWFGVLQTMNFDRAARVGITLMIRRSRLRVLSVLCRIAGVPGSSKEPVSLDISHGDLQPMVNLSRSVLTGILDDLESEGRVQRHYRRLTIPDPQSLWQQFVIESRPAG